LSFDEGVKSELVMIERLLSRAFLAWRTGSWQGQRIASRLEVRWGGVGRRGATLEDTRLAFAGQPGSGGPTARLVARFEADSWWNTTLWCVEGVASLIHLSVTGYASTKRACGLAGCALDQ
jgi:hypothetical protein